MMSSRFFELIELYRVRKIFRELERELDREMRGRLRHRLYRKICDIEERWEAHLDGESS